MLGNDKKLIKVLSLSFEFDLAPDLPIPAAPGLDGLSGSCGPFRDFQAAWKAIGQPPVPWQWYLHAWLSELVGYLPQGRYHQNQPPRCHPAHAYPGIEPPESQRFRFRHSRRTGR